MSWRLRQQNFRAKLVRSSWVTPPAGLGGTWHPSPTPPKPLPGPSPLAGREPAALKKKTRLMQLGKEGTWAAGLAPQVRPLARSPGTRRRAQQGACTCQHADPCIRDADILSQQERGAAAPEPACSCPDARGLSSEHLAGPLPLPRGHHQTQRSKRPPEVWLAKEFLKWILGCASHKRTRKVWDLGA